MFLTHLHSDHFRELPALLSAGRPNGLPQNTEKPVAVWGPGNRGGLPPLFGRAPEPPVVARIGVGTRS